MSNLSQQLKRPPHDEGALMMMLPVSAYSSSKRRRPSASSAALVSIAKLPDDEDDSSWSKEEHRTFVQAVYEVGLKHSSPAVIHEHMVSCNDEKVTGERLKSHLQKYRKNIDKNRDEFLNEYDNWLDKALAVGTIPAGGDDTLLVDDGRFYRLLPPMTVADVTGAKSILGGEAPAFVTYSLMYEQCALVDPSSAADEADTSQAASIDLRGPDRSESPSYAEPHQAFSFPILTDEERNSPLGACFSRVMGLFHPMSQLLQLEREKNRALDVTGDLSDGPD
jgi:SHAQKYF class myb-like DNA-binding protein